MPWNVKVEQSYEQFKKTKTLQTCNEGNYGIESIQNSQVFNFQGPLLQEMLIDGQPVKLAKHLGFFLQHTYN